MKVDLFKSLYFWLYLIAVALIGVLVWWLISSYPLVEKTDDENTVETIDWDDDSTVEGADFIGLHEAEARELARKSNTPYRVVSRDGEDVEINPDFNSARINFWMEDDVVVDAMSDNEMNTAR